MISPSFEPSDIHIIRKFSSIIKDSVLKYKQSLSGITSKELKALEDDVESTVMRLKHALESVSRERDVLKREISSSRPLTSDSHSSLKRNNQNKSVRVSFMDDSAGLVSELKGRLNESEMQLKNLEIEYGNLILNQNAKLQILNAKLTASNNRADRLEHEKKLFCESNGILRRRVSILESRLSSFEVSKNSMKSDSNFKSPQNVSTDSSKRIKKGRIQLEGPLQIHNPHDNSPNRFSNHIISPSPSPASSPRFLSPRGSVDLGFEVRIEQDIDKVLRPSLASPRLSIGPNKQDTSNYLSNSTSRAVNFKLNAAQPSSLDGVNIRANEERSGTHKRGDFRLEQPMEKLMRFAKQKAAMEEERRRETARIALVNRCERLQDQVRTFAKVLRMFLEFARDCAVSLICPVCENPLKTPKVFVPCGHLCCSDCCAKSPTHDRTFHSVGFDAAVEALGDTFATAFCSASCPECILHKSIQESKLSDGKMNEALSSTSHRKIQDVKAAAAALVRGSLMQQTKNHQTIEQDRNDSLHLPSETGGDLNTNQPSVDGRFANKYHADSSKVILKPSDGISLIGVSSCSSLIAVTRALKRLTSQLPIRSLIKSVRPYGEGINTIAVSLESAYAYPVSNQFASPTSLPPSSIPAFINHHGSFNNQRMKEGQTFAKNNAGSSLLNPAPPHILFMGGLVRENFLFSEAAAGEVAVMLLKFVNNPTNACDLPEPIFDGFDEETARKMYGNENMSGVKRTKEDLQILHSETSVQSQIQEMLDRACCLAEWFGGEEIDYEEVSRLKLTKNKIWTQFKGWMLNSHDDDEDDIDDQDEDALHEFNINNNLIDNKNVPNEAPNAKRSARSSMTLPMNSASQHLIPKPPSMKTTASILKRNSTSQTNLPNGSAKRLGRSLKAQSSSNIAQNNVLPMSKSFNSAITSAESDADTSVAMLQQMKSIVASGERHLAQMLADDTSRSIGIQTVRKFNRREKLRSRADNLSSQATRRTRRMRMEKLRRTQKVALCSAVATREFKRLHSIILHSAMSGHPATGDMTPMDILMQTAMILDRLISTSASLLEGSPTVAAKVIQREIADGGSFTPTVKANAIQLGDGKLKQHDGGNVLKRNNSTLVNDPSEPQKNTSDSDLVNMLFNHSNNSNRTSVNFSNLLVDLKGLFSGGLPPEAFTKIRRAEYPLPKSPSSSSSSSKEIDEAKSDFSISPSFLSDCDNSEFDSSPAKNSPQAKKKSHSPMPRRFETDEIKPNGFVPAIFGAMINASFKQKSDFLKAKHLNLQSKHLKSRSPMAVAETICKNSDFIDNVRKVIPQLHNGTYRSPNTYSKLNQVLHSSPSQKIKQKNQKLNESSKPFSPIRGGSRNKQKQNYEALINGEFSISFDRTTGHPKIIRSSKNERLRVERGLVEASKAACGLPIRGVTVSDMIGEELRVRERDAKRSNKKKKKEFVVGGLDKDEKKKLWDLTSGLIGGESSETSSESSCSESVKNTLRISKDRDGKKIRKSRSSATSEMDRRVNKFESMGLKNVSADDDAQIAREELSLRKLDNRRELGKNWINTLRSKEYDVFY